jgi:hypothetical protein
MPLTEGRGQRVALCSAYIIWEADMESDPRQPNRTRENVIILTLTLIVGGLLIFFLDLISFGIFTYALAVGAGVFLLGCFHYLLWGRSMTEQVAAEREALLREEQDRAEEVAEGIQDLSQRRGIKRGRPGKPIP